MFTFAGEERLVVERHKLDIIAAVQVTTIGARQRIIDQCRFKARDPRGTLLVFQRQPFQQPFRALRFSSFSNLWLCPANHNVSKMKIAVLNTG